MTETIVVVDDEPEVRALAREALEALGYIVLDTGDPQQALRNREGSAGSATLDKCCHAADEGR
jgi:CheY-like chemotaxis protein